jgi:hypothetical protein
LKQTFAGPEPVLFVPHWLPATQSVEVLQLFVQ